MQPWHQVFMQKLPALRSKYVEDSQKLLQSFSDAVIESAQVICGQMNQSYQVLQEEIQQQQDRLKAHSNAVLTDEVETVKKNSHRLVGPLIKKTMEPGYNAGAEQKGKSILGQGVVFARVELTLGREEKFREGSQECPRTHAAGWQVHVSECRTRSEGCLGEFSR